MTKNALLGIWVTCILALLLSAFLHTSAAATSIPFHQVPAPIPGTIQAEDFDYGGEGVAYHDTSPGNTGGAYRQTDVDIAGNADNTGYVVGWVAPSEWLNYGVNVATAGNYTVEFNVASFGQGGTFHLEMNGTNVTGTLTVPDTGDWQNWQTVTAVVTLAAGPQTARLVMDTSGLYAVGNFDWMRFSVAPAPTPSPTPTAYLGWPALIPGTVQAADFDNGGEGVAYHDATPGNAGGAYRTTDVDIAASVEGGFTVGWIDPGEWLNFTVLVSESGNYVAQIRVAAPGSGTSLHIGFNKSPGSWTSVSIPATGDWQSWTTVNVPLTLTAGVQQLTLGFDTGWYNVSYVTVVPDEAPPTDPPMPPPPPPPPPSGAPATYSAISDRVVRPKPALPALGPAGYAFTDPTFGSALLRVTDANTRPRSPGVSYRSPSETPNRAWNLNSTRFYVTSTDGTIVPFAFDPSTMKASRIPGSQDGGLILYFDAEPEFSAIDPDVAYGRSSQYDHAVVTQYNFATGSYSVIADTRSIVPSVDAAGRTYLRGVETGTTAGVEFMTFIFGGTSQDRDHYAVWFPVNDPASRKLVDTAASTINGVPTNITLGFNAHAVAIDQSGRFVVIGATAPDIAVGKAPNYVWDTLTDTFTPMTLSAGGHGALGFGVNINNPDDTDSTDFTFRHLDDVSSTSLLVYPAPAPRDFSVSSHASWSNAQPIQLVPILAGMFRYGNNTKPWREWDEEIIAIRTDGVESRVWRFAHHRSNYNNNGPTDTNPFWYTPRPNISSDGQWAIFTSNWEKTLGDDTREQNKRQDVFVIKLQ